MTVRDASAAVRRMAAWAAVVAGLATLVISVTFAVLPETTAAVRACGGRAPSLVRFQLALTVADVQEALGPAGPCRDAAVVAMDAVNRLDVRAYIASYGAFLLFALFVVMHEARRSGFWIIAVVVVVALVADVVETVVQLAMTKDLAGAQVHIPILMVAARVKFVGLAIAALAASWAGWHARPRRFVLAISCVPVCLTPLAVVVPKSFGDMLPFALAVAWVVLLATVLRIALRRPA